MMPDITKFEFLRALILFPIRSLFAEEGALSDMVRTANAYYRASFNRTPAIDKAVMLPHCLVSRKCPAKFSKEDGILCVSCKLCKCGEIKALCEERGMQFYITPSMGFTKRLADRKQLRAALGITCGFEIGRGLKSTRLTLKGVDLRERRVIPQVVLTTKYDCMDNDADWDLLRRIILNGA
ncbi:MAG: hypothetical protein CVU53_04500 [Deltaproteobacteria bacterium HGW-Deltaproteobacteria-11]|nr:MAG: hypothetical protein CVU53_04500 [Deltaproteobacteria bacterium HGW-Deltaproteobacteria-11]